MYEPNEYTALRPCGSQRLMSLSIPDDLYLYQHLMSNSNMVVLQPRRVTLHREPGLHVNAPGTPVDDVWHL